jgi:hypothetical protein
MIFTNDLTRSKKTILIGDVYVAVALRGLKARGIAPCTVYMQLYCMCQGMIERLNDASYRVHNNNNRNECC